MTAYYTRLVTVRNRAWSAFGPWFGLKGANRRISYKRLVSRFKLSSHHLVVPTIPPGPHPIQPGPLLTTDPRPLLLTVPTSEIS